MSLLNEMLKDLDATKARVKPKSIFIPVQAETFSSRLKDYLPWLLMGMILFLFSALVIKSLQGLQHASVLLLPAKPVTEFPSTIPKVALKVSHPVSEIVSIKNSQFQSYVEATPAAEPVVPQALSTDVNKIFIQLTPTEWHDDKLNKALDAIEEGDEAKAIRLLEKVLAKMPNAMDARENLAALYLSRADYGKVLTLVDEGLAQHPHSQALAVLKARLLFEQDNPREAADLLSPFQPNIQEDPDFYGLKAAIFQALGHTADAGSIYKMLIQIEPQNGQYWLGYALSLEENHAKQQAITAYQHASQSYDTDPTVRAFAEKRLKILQG